ncbi:MAG: hypothetical protein BAJATHORv1_40361 [Candidatus Thorarchaeota archaeon]|nr:MAG: hypothetical protein BAJATHORv1_40361 [Candidatus Thorarchaeota archaeon]
MVFLILSENDVISEELAEHLIEMARFRNRVVHLYQCFDDAILYKILQTNLRDIEEFTRFIVEYTEHN